MGEPVRRYRFTVADYHRMGEAGIFADGPRVELVGGEVVEVSPIGRRHAVCVNELTKLFVDLCGERAIVQVQNPIGLDDASEPQPDISILRTRPDKYMTETPGPSDVLLAIEVADTTIRFDRTVKAPLYGAAGVPHLWVLDLNADVLEMYSEPSPGGYRLIRIVRRGESLTAPLPGEPVLTLDDLLPELTESGD